MGRTSFSFCRTGSAAGQACSNRLAVPTAPTSFQADGYKEKPGTRWSEQRRRGQSLHPETPYVLFQFSLIVGRKRRYRGILPRVEEESCRIKGYQPLLLGGLPLCRQPTSWCLESHSRERLPGLMSGLLGPED